MHPLLKLNEKVNKLQKNRSTKGYVDGLFPRYSDAYPCLTEFSGDYWHYIWHSERNIEYYRQDDLWLSKQIFITNVLSKKEGKILLDFEYYSFIESISIRFDTIKNEVLFININEDNILSLIPTNEVTNIDFNYVLMVNDYLNIYSENNSGIVQIKYRIIG